MAQQKNTFKCKVTTVFSNPSLNQIPAITPMQTIRRPPPKRSLSKGLHDQSESSEEAREDCNEPVTSAKVKSSLGIAFLGAGAGGASLCCSRASKASEDNPSSSTGCSSSESCRRHGRRTCGVDSSRVLGTAGIIVSARSLAGRIAAASVDTLVAIFLTLEKWYGLGVLGGIRAQAVSADAVVDKSGLS